MMSKISISFHDVKDSTRTRVLCWKKVSHILGKDIDLNILKRILLNIIVTAMFKDHPINLIIFIYVEGSKLINSVVNLRIIVLIMIHKIT